MNMNQSEENQQLVILVDDQDHELGACGKMDAHRDAKLHRAVSVLLCNSQNQWLIQKRAESKYHSGGLWSNTCCSHPVPGENARRAADRALRREMNIKCELSEALTCVYDLKMDNGLTEHEYNHVFTGRFDGNPQPDPSEVGDWKWTSARDLVEDMEKQPAFYTAWFRLIFGEMQALPCCR
jgi:isopentenyl-diphosphate delta-isomerase